MRRYTHFEWMELLSGILLVLLGIFTFIRPGKLLTGFILLYGLLALLTGISDVIFYVKTERYIGIGPTVSLVSGILSILSGLMLLFYPGIAKWALAVFFPLWFITHCVSRLSHLSFLNQFLEPGYCTFRMIVNVIGLILGCLLLIFPHASFMTLNYLVGIYLVLAGIDNIMFACRGNRHRW